MTLELSELGDCIHCGGTGMIIPPPEVISKTPSGRARRSHKILHKPALPCWACPAGAIEAKLLDELPGDDRGHK